MRVGDVRINLSGVDGGVAEELLDGADISAVREKVGGEDVAKHVRRDLLRNARLNPAFFYNPLNGAGREPRGNRFPD